MVERTKLRFECTQCGNCCTDKDTLVNVTYNDILRIKGGLNLTLDECLETLGFYIFEKEPLKEELKKMVIPPIETEKGLAFVGLKKNNEGICCFYNNKEKRCMIYRLRPNFCRTFPFSFKILLLGANRSEDKLEVYYTEKGKQYCPGISEEATPIDMEKWIQLGLRTIKDMNDNNVLLKKWNEAAKKGDISPNSRNFLLTIFNMEDKED